MELSEEVVLFFSGGEFEEDVVFGEGYAGAKIIDFFLCGERDFFVVNAGEFAVFFDCVFGREEGFITGFVNIGRNIRNGVRHNKWN